MIRWISDSYIVCLFPFIQTLWHPSDSRKSSISSRRKTARMTSKDRCLWQLTAVAVRVVITIQRIITEQHQLMMTQVIISLMWQLIWPNDRHVSKMRQVKLMSLSSWEEQLSSTAKSSICKTKRYCTFLNFSFCCLISYRFSSQSQFSNSSYYSIPLRISRYFYNAINLIKEWSRFHSSFTRRL